MLKLRFHSTSDVVLGPSRAFTFDGPLLRQYPDDEVVSRRSGRMWHLLNELAEETVAATFECSDRCQLQFEDRQGRTSPPYGPFGHLHFRENGVFADGKLFALFLPEMHKWQHCASGVRWPILKAFSAGHETSQAFAETG